MDRTLETAGASPRSAAPNLRGAYAVGVLILAYAFSYVDRTILTLLVKPIRESLRISDLQVSLLHGLAFAIFYTLLGVPIARLADRGNRKLIIVAGIVVWSSMTAACGFARNFAQLFLARVGVGVGEAALSPAAYSMISDYFDGNARTRALSIYTSAMYLGAGLALVVGGAAIALVPAVQLPGGRAFEPWQVVFFIVGLPGLLVALLMLTVREPPRSGLARGTRAGDSLPLASVFAHIRRHGRAYGLLTAGYSLHALMWNGAMAWIPTFLIRHHGLSQARTGLQFGLVLTLCGTLGVIGGGWLSGWLRDRGESAANPRVGLLSALAVLLPGALATQVASPQASLALFAVFVVFGSMPYGAAATAFQDITPNQMRAQVTSLYFLALNLCGIGLGPTAVAALTDKWFRSDLAVGESLSTVIVAASLLAALLLWLSLSPYRRAIAAPQPAGAPP